LYNLCTSDVARDVDNDVNEYFVSIMMNVIGR